MKYSKNPLTSWVIRTKNEEKWIGKVLEKLLEQSRLDFEIIIVDSGSTDKTLEIIKKFPVRKVIKIPQNEFHYSYALNVGIKESYGKIIGILSGHSMPSHRFWYESALKHFKDDTVAGVGGQYTSLPDGSLDEKIGDMNYHVTKFNERKGDSIYDGWLPHELFAEFSNSNSLIRKKYWKLYNFNETLKGSEDYDWAQEMISRNYRIVFEPLFNVYHSHGGIDRPTLHDRMSEWQKLNLEIDKKRK
ncbi:glycosyltransferase [bacterium]|nr:MAG: glycosyltransferase [bacterium]